MKVVSQFKTNLYCYKLTCLFWVFVTIAAENGPGAVKQFKRVIAESDALYVERPSHFGGLLNGIEGWRLMEFPDEFHAKDRRVACNIVVFFVLCFGIELLAHMYFTDKNDKYPWIVAAHSYVHDTNQPGEVDIARFELPSSAKTGNYVVQWSWSGYYDCIDVAYVGNAMTVPVSMFFCDFSGAI
jgi:hypothetical protein